MAKVAGTITARLMCRTHKRVLFHGRGRLAAAAAGVLLGSMVWSVPTTAAPVDIASDHVALGAFQRFQSAIASSCPNVLAALNSVPLSSLNRGTITAFGEEAGFDLVLVSNVPDRVSLSALTRTLSGLRWSSHQTAVKIRRSLDNERRLLFLPSSDLCADARAIAASNAQVTPAASLRFLATVARVNRAAAALDGVVKILQRFQTAADRHVVDSANRAGARARAMLARLIRVEAPKLSSALGLSQ